jgi:hypothetical protein
MRRVRMQVKHAVHGRLPRAWPPAGMPRPAAGVSRRAHDAISEKQDEVAWNATTGTLTVSWKRWRDCEILRLRAKFKSVRPDVVVLG